MDFRGLAVIVIGAAPFVGTAPNAPTGPCFFFPWMSDPVSHVKNRRNQDQEEN